MTVTVNIIGDRLLIDRLRRFSGRIPVDLRREVTAIARDLATYVKVAKLSGQVLRNRTGTLRRSIHHSVRLEPKEIVGIVGTNVSYARVHEYGFRGSVAVRAHERLGFPVRPHARNVTIRERSFLRSALAEKRHQITQRMHRVLAQAATSVVDKK